MKFVTSLLICLLCATAPVAGQQMVPVDILALFDQVPPPPASSQEAYSRAGCAEQQRCDAGKVYGPIEARFTAIELQIQTAASAYLHQAQPGQGIQRMTPAELQELQKKLQSMSQEEQMKFSMEMSRQNTVALKPEPAAAVRAALDEVQTIREQMELQAMGQSRRHFVDVIAQLQAEAERKHREADAWATDDRFKDAQGLPTEAWEKAQVEAMAMGIAAEQDYLQALLSAFNEEMAWQTALFSPFQKRLAASRYGEDAVNAMSRSDLLSIQQAMLKAAGRLLAASRDATERSAKLWERKLAADRMH